MQTPTPIDLVNPAQAGAQLGVDDEALLDLVNSGRLPAYNLGGAIRFKLVEVVAISSVLTAA